MPPPHPHGPTPPRRRRGWRIAGAVVAGLVLLVGGVLFWAWWDFQNTTGWVLPAPNERHLEPIPMGVAPVAMDGYLLVPGEVGPAAAGTMAVYGDVSGARVRISEHGPDYWENAVRGERGGGDWNTYGNLMCQDRGSNPYCAMKFSDRVLVVQGQDVTQQEVAEATEAYLAGRRGESTGDEWAGTEPPNLGSLPPIKDRLDSVLTAESDDLLLSAATPQQVGYEDRHTWWTVQYGPGDVPMLKVVAYKTHEPWAYAVHEGGARPYGDVLCSDTTTGSVCVLAGEDGMLLAEGMVVPEAIAEVLHD